jgi:3-hydroxy-3-methylglutaryl CoA synthase
LLSLLLSGLTAEQGGEGLNLIGKRVMMFSYGSGCAASMFSFRVKEGYQRVIEKSNFKQRLEQGRVKVTPEEFSQWMDLREQNYVKHPPTYQPKVRTHLNFYNVNLLIIYRAPLTTCSRERST